MTSEATSGGDETFVVGGEQLPVDARLVVVPLEKRPTGQLNEVAIADVVLRKKCEVVVELLAAVTRPAVVVEPPPTCDALAAVVMSHVGLGTKDWLDALSPTFLVELDDAIHVAVVRDAKCRLTVGDGFGDELF